MISHIRGPVVEITDKYVVIETNGLGYRVFATTDTLRSLALDVETKLYTYLAIREDAHELYGFLSSGERELFEMLISVSGIGPKSGLGILGLASIDLLSHAIASGDTGYLTKVSGIGRKTAEKIVIELRDKLASRIDIGKRPMELRGSGDVMDALKVLGYSEREIREVLGNIPEDIADTNARLKYALKLLGKK